MARRTLFTPGRTWYRLADWALAIAQQLQEARRRGRGR